MSPEGKLIVFSAPSGSGKTTLVHYLLDTMPELAFSVSATTRKPRAHEIDGLDYFFISVKKFRKKIRQEEFVEWEEVYKDNFYGTLKSELERIWAEGKHVIFDIDVIGGITIKNKFPERTLAIFVNPPSLQELERRLRERDTDSEEKIQMRLQKSARELRYADQFDYILENDNLAKAKEEANELVHDFIYGHKR